MSNPTRMLTRFKRLACIFIPFMSGVNQNKCFLVLSYSTPGIFTINLDVLVRQLVYVMPTDLLGQRQIDDPIRFDNPRNHTLCFGHLLKFHPQS